MSRTWFKPFFSPDWHTPDKRGLNSLCGQWPAYASAKRMPRPSNAPGNCPVCQRLLAEVTK